MKLIRKITIAFFSFLVVISTTIHAQTIAGIICYQQKITLSFKNTANKTQENDSTGLKSLLLMMAEGKEVSLYHKIIFSGSLSKKYGVDEINSSIKNTYSSDSYVAIRNNIKKTEDNFKIKDKKIVPTATKKFGTLNYKYTGITKKILGFSCKEISYEVEEENKKVEFRVMVTSD
ncbi:MAG: hypothetical protein LH615_05680, partial [Ferruginibacter sp.]|nr:hypothetical protein [Ferruginibacter sp.]